MFLFIQINYVSSCSVIPLGMANATTCDDQSCVFNIFNNLYAPLSSLSSSCIKFSGDQNVSIELSLLTVLKKYTSQYCYYTDAPIYFSKAWCGCPLGVRDYCPCSKAPLANIKYQFCTNHVGSTAYCAMSFLDKSVSVCANHGIEVFPRFKICHYQQQPKYYISFEVTFNGNKTIVSSNDLGLIDADIAPGLRLISDMNGVIGDFIPKFTVFDMQKPTSFYISDETNTNGIDGFDPFKMGWVKMGLGTKNDFSQLTGKVNMTLLNCLQNSIKYSYPFLQIDEFLTQHKELNAANILPASVLFDSELPTYIVADPNSEGHLLGNDFFQLKDGYLGMNENNKPVIIGLNTYNKPTISYFGERSLPTTPVKTNCGVKTLDYSWSLYHTLEKPVEPYTQISTYIYFDSKTNCYGVERWHLGPDGWEIKNYGDTINAYVWPDNVVRTVSYEGTTSIVTRNLKTTWNELSVPIIKGFLMMTISGQLKLSVQTRLHSKSHIDYCETDNNNSTISCQITNSGIEQTCTLTTEPSVTVMSLVTLQNGKNMKYLYPSANYTGMTQVRLSCGKYVSNHNVFLNFTIDTYTGQTISLSATSAVATNIVDDVSSFFANMLSIIPSFSLSDLFSNVSLVRVLTYITIAIIIVIILSIVTVIFMFTYPYIKLIAQVLFVSCRKVKGSINDIKREVKNSDDYVSLSSTVLKNNETNTKTINSRFIKNNSDFTEREIMMEMAKLRKSYDLTGRTDDEVKSMAIENLKYFKKK